MTVECSAFKEASISPFLRLRDHIQRWGKEMLKEGHEILSLGRT